MRLIDADWLLDVVENIIVWDTERDKNRAIHQVRELTPTIEPEQRWIPMIERPPEVDVDVLVTEDTGGMKEVRIDSCWVDGDTESALWYTSLNVTAWMPLPKPYKGGKG